ncbi:MAG: ABC-F family ATP-binding cassette domain-containing protein [Candidatus Moranbacteria bacterium]|nr:ABC-F family ATP-binding cassette domain-containing protein [Candidatus Moranbacteria bacterium]
MLTVRKLFKRYGPIRVLLGAEFSVSRGQKVALVGANGVGKTTLLRIIAGVEKEDRGEVVRERRASISYLPQEVSDEASDDTALGYLRRVSGIAELELEMAELESKLTDEESLERYGDLRDRYDRMDGYSFDEKAAVALSGLGLRGDFLNRNLSGISGGERRRVALAASLLSGADLLLLDEPTNDLDLSAILWLESYLKKSASAVIVASHDRAFLDSVADKVLEIDWHFRTTRIWTGNYSLYFKEKAEELRRDREEYERSESERVRLYETADEKREWAKIGGAQMMPDKDRMSQGYHRDRAERKFGAAAHALTTRADQVKRVSIAAVRDPLAIYFEPSEGEGRDIALVGAVTGYGDAFSAGPVDLAIPYGAHVGLFGRNGSGKSTILRMIAGTLPLSSGTVSLGDDVKLGTLTQENDIIPKEKSALEWFEQETEIKDENEIIRFLRKFLLIGDVASFKMGELSPGERMRLSLAFLMATRSNVLILDEPTNHLDLEAVSALSEAVDLFPGTVILVSHDRAFLQNRAFSQVLSVDDGKLFVEKDYDTYLKKAVQDAGQHM